MKKRKLEEPESSRVAKKMLNLLYKGETLLSAHEDKAILLLGNSGVGKSTLGYSLSNDKVTYTYDYTTWIGNSNIQPSYLQRSNYFSPTTTTIPNKFLVFDDIAVWDCPGFDNNVGIAQKLATSVYIDKLAKQHKKIKFVLVTSYFELTKDTGSNFIQSVKKFSDIFKDVSSVCNSVSLVVTKVHLDVKLQDLKNCLSQLKKFKIVKNHLQENDQTIVENVMKMLSYLKKNILWFTCLSEKNVTHSSYYERIHSYSKYIDTTNNVTELKLQKEVINYILKPNFVHDINFMYDTKPNKLKHTSHQNFIKILIETRAKIDLQKQPNTVVASLCTTAVKDNNKRLLELLILNKADMNLLDENGNTPLHKACSLNLYEISKVLIEQGRAGLTTKNTVGKTPYSTLQKKGELHDYIVRFLFKNDLLGQSLCTKDIFSKIYTDITSELKKENLVNTLREKLIHLKNNKLLSTIIEIANVQNMKIFLSTIACKGEKSVTLGKYYHESNNIAVFDIENSTIEEILLTMMHEFTHLVNKIIFRNSADPFYPTATLKKVKLTELGNKLKELANSPFYKLIIYDTDKFSAEIPAIFVEILVKAVLKNEKIPYKTTDEKMLFQEMFEVFQYINPQIEKSDLLYFDDTSHQLLSLGNLGSNSLLDTPN